MRHDNDDMLSPFANDVVWVLLALMLVLAGCGMAVAKGMGLWDSAPRVPNYYQDR